MSILIVGCNPFISKELRRKNKCNRKVEKELKRHKKKVAKIAVNCPEIIKEEVVVDTVEIEVPKVELDSFIVIKKDTAQIDSLVSLIKNKKTREVIRKYITEYIPFKDTVIHLKDGFKVKFYSVNGNIHYSIDKPAERIKKKVRTKVPVVAKIELTTWEKIINGAKDFWWVIVLFLSIFIVFSMIRKRFL